MAKKDPVFSKDEIMSDNTHANYCQQCKDCILWGIGDDPFQNRYDKGNCSMFPNPTCPLPSKRRKASIFSPIWRIFESPMPSHFCVIPI